MTEIDLDSHLAAISAGDADAFARWMAGAEAPLRRSMARFAAQVDVEAVLQETLLRTWQIAPRFTPDGRPNGLLRCAHRIARNLAVSEVRRRKGRELELTEDDRTVGPVAPDPLLRKVIAKCREKLPPKPAAALIARIGAEGGVADATLAEGLGQSLNTFLQSFGRARKLLLLCLEKNGVQLEEVLA